MPVCWQRSCSPLGWAGCRSRRCGGFALLAGLLATTFATARQPYVPAIVTDDRLVRANAGISAGEDALSFLGSALCLATIRTHEPQPQIAAPRELGISVGLRTSAADPGLRALAVIAVLSSFALELVGVVYMLFVRRELGFAQGILGMLFAIGSVAALASSATAERIGVALGPIRACSSRA